MPQRLCLSKFRAVLFDVDGTLLDSLKAVVRGLGDTSETYFGYRPADTDILSLIGKPIRVQLETFSPTQLGPKQIDEITLHAIERFEVHKDLEQLYLPAVEALELCHRCGTKTALVTSKSALELDLFLSRFSGASAVDTTVCSNDVKQPKPHPESALLACERLGVEPHEAVFVGDSIYDIRCARDAGIPAVAVTYGAAPRDVLVAESPSLILDSPDMLLEWAQASFLEMPCPERS